MSILEISVLLFALIFGGAMKGATGIGVPIIAVPVLAAYFDLRFAIAVILLPNLLSNAWQVWRYKAERPPRYLILSTLIGASVGIAMGVYLLVYLPVRWLNIGIAVSILIFVLSRIIKPDWSLGEPVGKVLALPSMMLGGMMQGATGISAPVIMMYLSSLRLDRGSFIFAVSLAFLVNATAHIPAMIVAGLFSQQQFLLSLLALIPVMAGIPLGERIAKYMSAELFNRVVMLLLIVLAAKLGFSAMSA